MKKFLLYLMPVMLLAGCARGLIEDFEMVGGAPETTEMRTRSLEGAVYNEVIDAWMIPQPDPYTLENFQKAYDKLSSGKSAQALTKAQAAEFATAKKLKPTHYALKIYPRSEEEQWRVEMMEDVQVAYIPFDYARLAKEEVAKVRQTRSVANTFAEKSPYTVTYNYTDATDGGPTGPETLQLPILYTVWPVDKPLPDDLEYVVDYDVFLPREAPLIRSAEMMQLLEKEARAFVSGVSARDDYYGGPVWSLVSGRILTYDNSLHENVPMANLCLYWNEGSTVKHYKTDDNGYFSFDAPTTGIEEWWPATLYAVFQDSKLWPNNSSPRWRITKAELNTTIPHEISVTVFDVHHRPTPLPLGDIVLESDERRANEIHRAVNYFYNAQTDFEPHYISTPVKIRAYNVSNSNANGSFNYPASIRIYKNGTLNGKVIGTVLHELGHFAHYQNNPNNWAYPENGFLIESFASYAGWYLGQQYYTSLGWIHPGGNPEIAGPARQGWWKDYNVPVSDYNNMGWYSPLFIDLTDNYNQKRTPSSSRPNDEIENMPAYVIWSIITTSTSWAQCRSQLEYYVGIFYTDTEFNNWIADFDHWFENYNN